MSSVSHDDLGQAVARLANGGLDPVDEHLRAATATALFGEQAPPVQIDRFTVVHPVGAGAMGRVFRAHDPELDRDVAIKLIHRTSSADHRRILAEARTLARLNHPNIVAVYEAGLYKGAPFIAMEFVAGATLEQHIASGPLPWKLLESWFVAAGQGLAAAHDAKVIHRDFKPSNVLVGADGRVRVVDFGLARLLDERDGCVSAAPDDQLLAASSQPTRAGAGTPAYMPPEQWGRSQPDLRMDQFAFCVALYRALTGAFPFAADPLIRQAEIVRGLAYPSQAPHLPRWLFRVLARGLAADPARRFESMHALLQALQARSRRVRAGLLSLGLLSTAATAFAFGASFSDPDPCATVEQETLSLWSPDQLPQVRSALLAPAAGTRVLDQAAAAVTHYVEQLAQAKAETCAATWIRHEQSTDLLDRKMSCLSRREISVKAIVSTLNPRTSSDHLERIPDMVAALPLIATCANPDTLVASPELPEAAGLRGQVTALWQRIDEFTVALALGELTNVEHAAEVAELIATARRLAYEPALIEALLLQGNLRFAQADYAAAAPLYTEAVWQAEAVRLDDAAGRAALALGRIHLQEDAHPAEAEIWLDHAKAAFLRAGREQGLTVALARARSRLSALRGEGTEAVRWAQQAVELAPSLLSRVKSRRELASAYEAASQPEAAETEYREAIAEAIAGFGSVHDTVAVLQVDYGGFLLWQERPAEAIEPLQQALTTFLQIDAAPQKPLATQGALANALELAGRMEEAERHSRAALRGLEHIHGPDHPLVRGSRINVGNQVYNLGRYEEALQLCEQSLALGSEGLPFDPLNVRGVACATEALLALSRGREAQTRIENLLAAFKPQDDLGDRALLQFRLAQVLHASGGPPARVRHLVADAAVGYRQSLGLAPEQISPPEAWLSRQTLR